MDDIPWRNKLQPARLMDTHTVPLMGGPDDPQIEHLIDLMKHHGEKGLWWPARLLFVLRDGLGKLFGWDSEERQSSIHPQSFYWKMTDEERSRCKLSPGGKEGPALILWNDDYSLCLEVLNETCQAFAVGFVRDRKAHLSVFVIETKWWSKYYLALIEPFRKYIVYPAGVRWLEQLWAKNWNVPSS